MSKAIDKDLLFDALTKCVHIEDVKYIKFDKHEYSRTIYFKALGAEYNIEWWNNLCYLKFGRGCQLPFTGIEINGFWPNRYKTSINFLDASGERVFVLPIQEYDNEQAG